MLIGVNLKPIFFVSVQDNHHLPYSISNVSPAVSQTYLPSMPPNGGPIEGAQAGKGFWK